LLAFGLVLTTNAVTIAWSFAALAIAIAYPYAKRFVSMPQAVLGVAFSFGIPMAFSAVRVQIKPFCCARRVPALAWVLLAGNLFWVLAYDTEYAMVDRDDDLKIGMKTSAITLGRHGMCRPSCSFYAMYLSMWVFALVSGGGARPGVLPGAIAVALAQAAWHWTLIRAPHARRLLQGLPAEPLAGLQRVCRDRCELRPGILRQKRPAVVAFWATRSAPTRVSRARILHPVRPPAGRAACSALA
jgi:4-hydroxybenzoate polyprenyltransferase